MRYDNWDVLLFLSSSKAPIQEFKTEAYSVDDLEGSPIIDVFGFPTTAPASDTTSGTLAVSATLAPRQDVQTAHPLPQTISYPKMPILTAFVPSQAEGNPFKISIHNWEQIRYLLEPSVLQTQGRLPCHQIRLFIDGKIICTQIIRPDTVLPVIIETRPSPNPRINRDYLRWPQFHSDQLDQATWNASDDYGRVKVVISEGYLNQENNFLIRGRNIVAFAFQHAPLQILKTAGIAWPNDELWQKPVTIVAGNAASITTRSDAKQDPIMTDSPPKLRVSNGIWGDAQSPNRTLTTNTPLLSTNNSILSLGTGVDDMLAELPSATIGTAQRQVLAPRPANVISIDNRMSSESSRNASVGQENQIPNVGGLDYYSLPGLAPILGFPIKDTARVKAEDNELAELTPKAKGKGKAPAKRATRAKTTTGAANTSPNKVVKVRKPAAKKMTATAAASTAEAPGISDQIPMDGIMSADSQQIDAQDKVTTDVIEKPLPTLPLMSLEAMAQEDSMTSALEQDVNPTIQASTTSI